MWLDRHGADVGLGGTIVFNILVGRISKAEGQPAGCLSALEGSTILEE
jgi:hypothetical protein